MIIGLLLLTISCKLEKKKWWVPVYGHAGTSIYADRAIYPPNTFESVEYAIDVLDADGVEVDVQLTKDSVLILYHDQNLDSQTNGSGCVGDYNWSELQQLDFHSKRYQLMRLDEILDFVLNRYKRVILDVKHLNACNQTSVSESSFNFALSSALNGLDSLLLGNVTIHSRSVDLISSVNYPHLKRSFESDDVAEAIQVYTTHNLDQIALKLSVLNSGLAASLRDSAIPFYIFGLKTQREHREAYALQPDGLISDNIAFGKKLSN